MSAQPKRPKPTLDRSEDSQETTDVIQLHAAILREHSEPQEGREPLSLWFVLMMSALLFWGGFYLQRYSGNYQPLVYNEHTSGLASASTGPVPAVNMAVLGKRLFADTCAKCHQIDGQGTPGKYPPLAGSEWLLARGTARIIRIVLDGLQGPIQVKGVNYNEQMVPWRDTLSDPQIAAILTYVRTEKTWGNTAGEVKPEEVADIRQKTKARPSTGAWTADELKALPEIEPAVPGNPPGGTNAPTNTNAPAGAAPATS